MYLIWMVLCFEATKPLQNILIVLLMGWQIEE